MGSEELDKHLKTVQEDPSSLLNVGASIGHYLPEHQIAMAQTIGQATDYLNQLRPKSTKNSPLDKDLPASPIQTSNFKKALAVADDPLSMVDKIKDGTLTSEDVLHLHNLFPDLHARLVQKLNDKMTEHLSDGHSISSRTQRMLSLLSGQNLNSAHSPAAIQSSQSTFQAGAPTPSDQAPGGGHGSSNKAPVSSLKKISTMDATPLQKIAMSKPT